MYNGIKGQIFPANWQVITVGTPDPKEAFRKLNHDAQASLRQEKPAKVLNGPLLPGPEPADKLVVIGVSTGGPVTLMKVIPHLPANLRAAVVIVQHMPQWVTQSLVDRLSAASRLKVKEMQHQELLQNGICYIVPGGHHLQMNRASDRPKLIAAAPEQLNQTVGLLNIDGAMSALLERFGGRRTVGVLLTGMGDDGADGMVKIRKAGGLTIAEDQSTAVVFGMPREAIERGGASLILPVHKIAEAIVKQINGPLGGN